MRFSAVVAAFLVAVLFLGCSDDEPPAPAPTAPADETSSPSATGTTGAGTPGIITGLFRDPRPRQPDASVSVASRPASPFKPWDRESVVLYDIQQGKEVNFGRGYVASFSPDGKKLAFNPVEGDTGPSKVRVVDIATKASQEFELSGHGLAVFVDENHLYMPGSGGVQALDLRSGAKTPLSQVGDPVLRARLNRSASGGGELSPDGTQRLDNGLHRGEGDCGQRPGTPRAESELEHCRAEAAENWKVQDVATGDVLLEFRANTAKFVAPGELLVTTSPQCRARDGSMKWCEDVATELRADDPPLTFPDESVSGTTNIFLVNGDTKAAEFIATASYNARTRIQPMNWPLIANQQHVVWTESCFGQPQGKTRIYERATKRITELDTSLWVEITALGDLGVDEVGPRAILDIETLRWATVLPDNAIDVVQSPDGRYLALAGVLGHGGLCG